MNSHDYCLLDFSICGSLPDDVGDGDAGVAAGEVRVVPPTADGHAQAVAGHAAQNDHVLLPRNVAGLKHNNLCMQQPANMSLMIHCRNSQFYANAYTMN